MQVMPIVVDCVLVLTSLDIEIGEESISTHCIRSTLGLSAAHATLGLSAAHDSASAALPRSG